MFSFLFSNFKKLISKSLFSSSTTVGSTVFSTIVEFVWTVFTGELTSQDKIALKLNIIIINISKTNPAIAKNII